MRLLALALLIAAPMITAGPAHKVRIIRDNYGVPHIYADDVGALFFGYGYAVAQDRLFQIEMTRRSVWGTVAQVLGPDYLAFDRRTRQTGYTRVDVRSRIERLDQSYRTMLKAYADGINSFLSRGKLPAEFDKLGFRPARWTAEDVAQVFVGTMAARYSDSTRELENAALLNGLIKKFGETRGRAIFDDILPPSEDPQSIVTIPAAENWRPGNNSQKPTAALPRGIGAVWAKAGADEASYLGQLNVLNLASKMGSNAWVIGAARTGNKSAILMGGPQMGFTTPGYVHEVGLHGAGFDLVGATPAGYLPILFGHNANISWSSTAAGSSDVVDIFAETLDPTDPTRYRFKGEWRQMQAREEVFKVKGAVDVKDTFYRTVHGLVMVVDAKNHVAYARGRGWEGQELESMAGWIDKTRAQSLPEFLAASRKMALSINWFYADRKGDIGYVHNGRYPLRNAAQDLRLPTPGTGEREWQGFVPPGQTPHVSNPRQGFIANWNNQPAKGWFFAGSQWSHVDRAKTLMDFLAVKPVVTIDDVKALNRYAALAENTAQFFRPGLLQSVRGLGKDDAALQRAADLLAEWNGLREDNDGDGKYDSPGVAIFQAWLTHMLADTFSEAKVGPASAMLQYQPGDTPLGSKVLFRVLAGGAGIDYLGGASPPEAMVAGFRKAVALLRKDFGPDPGAWRVSTRKLVFRNQNFLQIPQAFHGQVELPEMNRGTENHLVVLSAAGVKGVNVAPPGESGNASGPHTADQLRLFADFNYKPMNFYSTDIARAAESEEELSYEPSAGIDTPPNRL